MNCGATGPIADKHRDDEQHAEWARRGHDVRESRLWRRDDADILDDEGQRRSGRGVAESVMMWAPEGRKKFEGRSSQFYSPSTITEALPRRKVPCVLPRLH